MYLGKYPDTNGLPPGYRGVAYAPEPPPERCEQSERCEPCEQPRGDCAPACPSDCSARTGCARGARGLLDHLFSHKIDMEDLLLLALTVMLLNSGADADLITMMALLFVMGL